MPSPTEQLAFRKQSLYLSLAFYYRRVNYRLVALTSRGNAYTKEMFLNSTMHVFIMILFVRSEVSHNYRNIICFLLCVLPQYNMYCIFSDRECRHLESYPRRQEDPTKYL
jgi:hypothetical protein